jgi:hypothetical protein
LLAVFAANPSDDQIIELCPTKLEERQGRPQINSTFFGDRIKDLRIDHKSELPQEDKVRLRACFSLPRLDT